MNSDIRILSELSNDDKLLIKRISDFIKACENKFMVKFSFFLDERQAKIVTTYLNSIKYDTYKLFGGCDNSKRQIIMIYPDYYDVDEVKFPITAIEFSYRNQDKLTHRDFLGCLMSLQIKRSLVGDIVVSQGKAIVFVYETIADLIIESIDKIGSVGVSARKVYNLNLKIEDNFESLNGSVASLRLDCITSLVTGLSREKAALIIKSSGIDINYFNIKDISYILKVGDIFSLRGYGKYILYSENGISKKGRKHITIKKYI